MGPFRGPFRGAPRPGARSPSVVEDLQLQVGRALRGVPPRRHLALRLVGGRQLEPPGDAGPRADHVDRRDHADADVGRVGDAQVTVPQELCCRDGGDLVHDL